MSLAYGGKGIRMALGSLQPVLFIAHLMNDTIKIEGKPQMYVCGVVFTNLLGCLMCDW